MPFNVSSLLRYANESTGNYTFERGSSRNGHQKKDSD